MGADKTENEGFKVNLLEYAYLVEDTDPCAEVFKIYVPKLMGNKTGGSSKSSQSVDKSSFANDSESSFQASNSAETKDYIEARVSPMTMIAHRHSFHDCPGNCVNATHDAVTCHPGTSHLKPCQHFHHDHHWPHIGDKGMIPANSRVIVIFMNNDINDCIVTRLICDFPTGNHPAPPRERR